MLLLVKLAIRVFNVLLAIKIIFLMLHQDVKIAQRGVRIVQVSINAQLVNLDFIYKLMTKIKSYASYAFLTVLYALVRIIVQNVRLVFILLQKIHVRNADKLVIAVKDQNNV